MGADYHHTVLKDATPFRDFTERCWVADTAEVPELPTQTDQEARREVLAAYVRVHFGSVNAFANALGRKQPQLNETLKGERSFGEKLARALEAEIVALRGTAEWRHLPPLEFDVAADSHSARLRQLIEYFESTSSESQDEIVEFARFKSTKSGTEAASTQVGREPPVRALGALRPGDKRTAKKRRTA
jgi:hypothetical protein